MSEKKIVKMGGSTAGPRRKGLVPSWTLQLAGWWAIFAGALTVTSICPICGNSACPIGAGSVGILSALLALVKLHGGRIIHIIGSVFSCRPTSQKHPPRGA